jgi:hypothetical protein
MDHFFKKIALKFGWSERKASKMLDRASRLKEMVEEHKDDDTVEHLNCDDLLKIRMQLAESGIELTPQEVQDGVELIKHLRKNLKE